MLVPRRLIGAAIALVLTSGWLLALPERAYAESAISPKSGNFTVRGSGFGHGWGMSQYGAYGAARNGLDWEQILRFYYPGTRLTTMPSGTTLRVWVTGDTDGSLRVRPAERADRVRLQRRALQGPVRLEVPVLADQPFRLRLHADLPQQQRQQRFGLDRPVQRHLVVQQLEQDHRGDHAERFGPAVPWLGRRWSSGAAAAAR